ncbi:serine hydrolase domain-containing protein [Balneola sp. MJW-20]|uniref:serine hydrolase domain-containing protein n=1 Tax=Gracilimonas aurantiaca TaxID=3234185 RepID=UPI003465C3CC
MKKLIFIPLFILSLTACQQDRSADIGHELNDYFEQSSLPSAVMGSIDKDGETQWYAFGPSVWDQSDTVTEDHIFRIYSMTKAITSVAAMQLVERGLIGLDDPLNDILPQMAAIPVLNEQGELVEAENDITLRHLLTHTAGFGYDFTSYRLQQFQPEEWEYQDKPRLFESGEDWKYGTGTDWVGRVVEKVSGDDLETYFRKNITGPLQMNRTWFNVPDSLQDLIVSWGMRGPAGFQENPRLPEEPATFFSGGGGLYGSPADYMTFLQCMLNYGSYDGGQILKKETVEMMLTDQLPPDVGINYEQFENGIMSYSGGFGDPADRWGLAWALENNPEDHPRPSGSVYWAGAANSYYTLDVENQLAVVYFTQFFPFNDKETYDFYRLFEQHVYINSGY